MEQFTQIIRLLLKNAILLVVLPVLAMVALAYLTRDTPLQYEIKSKFLFDFGGKSTNVSGETLNQQQIHTEFLNTIELVNSNRLIEKVRAKTALESITDSSDVYKYQWPIESKSDIVEFLQSIMNDERSPYLDNSTEGKAIFQFYEDLKLSAEGILDVIHARRLMNSNFLEIKLSYTDPDKLFYLGNMINDLLVEEIESISVKKIGRQKGVISELVRKAKEDLDAKVKELEDLKVQNNIINLGEQTKAIVGYQVQLEGKKSNLKTQIASADKGGTSIKEGIDSEEFIESYSPENEKLLSKKNNIYTAQDLKIIHLKGDDLDYSDFLKQQVVINRNRLGIKSNLEELSGNAVYDPNMINTDLTMQYINYRIKSDKLKDELNIVNSEIDRVREYAAYFAPFESKISSLRDEISTAQKTYLMFLNKLNITESLELSASNSKIELVDAPEYPYHSLPSKTKLIIVAGGVAVFILLVAFIVILFLLDNSIKDVKTFERRFRQHVVSALPKFPKTQHDAILIDALTTIHNESVKRIAKAIGDHRVVTVNSMTTKDDPSEVIKFLKKHWKKEKVGILVLTGDFHTIKEKIERSLKKYSRLLCLSQPLQFSADGITAAELSDCNFLHFSLGRLKTPVDRRILREYQSVSNNKGFILSDLQPEFMDSYVGEVPMTRNFVRKLIKKILKRELTWKK